MDLVAKKSLSFITTFLDSIFDAIKKSTGFFFNFIDQADPLQAFNPAMMYTSLVRWIFPILAVIIFCRCVLPLLYDDGYDKVWGFLDIPNGDSIPIKHWENSIGRSRLSDIIINLPFISRSHAVLRFDGKHWYITDLGSKGGVEVNDEQIEGTTKVQYGDTISLAGFESFLLPAVAEQKSLPPGGYLRWLSLLKSKYIFTSKKTLYLIMAFQLLGTIQISLSIGKDAAILQTLIGSFIVFIIAEMLIYVFLTRISKKYIELELLVFFLCGINFLIVSA
ncbi:MAG TPA: FHA domain-containing protein, partial [Anaerovoracaceae bacterium]|nr:FHA domain-containing protein [Anaerovoracaceae bacterium]